MLTPTKGKQTYHPTKGDAMYDAGKNAPLTEEPDLQGPPSASSLANDNNYKIGFDFAQSTFEGLTKEQRQTTVQGWDADLRKEKYELPAVQHPLRRTRLCGQLRDGPDRAATGEARGALRAPRCWSARAPAPRTPVPPTCASRPCPRMRSGPSSPSTR